MMQTSLFKMSLVSATMIAKGIKHFVLKPVAEKFDYLPGQFFTIQFSVDDKTYKRSYSIANYQELSGQIEFAASYVHKGIASEFLFALQPLDVITITGPYGRLVYKDNAKRIILVGTGTGITPYRAMLPLLKKKLLENPELEVVILQGVRHKEDILYAADFREFVRSMQTPRASFRACLSRHTGALAADEYTGHVQDQFDSLELAVENTFVYLCGNPNMIDASFKYFINKGFATSQIIREKYISSTKSVN